MELIEQDLNIYKNLSKYLLIGGDARMIELAYILKEQNKQVSTLGMEKAKLSDIYNYIDIKRAIDNNEVILGPIPFSREDNIINSKYALKPIEICKVFECLSDDKLFIAGAMNQNAKDIATKNNVRYIDYYLDESFQIDNAIPTAEGTLSILINETNITIHNSNILLLGYGRIGKVLSEYLKHLGANIKVAARKASDISWISARKIHGINLHNIEKHLPNIDIIINTIPTLVLDEKKLSYVNPTTLIVDLASMPGGVNFTYGKSKGIKIIHALGLPGKTANKTSAIYIFNAIKKYL